jgi:hypothetical protein
MAAKPSESCLFEPLCYKQAMVERKQHQPASKSQADNHSVPARQPAAAASALENPFAPAAVLSPKHVLQLQRQIGNQRVLRLLAGRSHAPAVQLTPLDNGQKVQVVALFALAPPANVPAVVHQEHLPTLQAFAAQLMPAVNNQSIRLQNLVLAIAKPNELAIGTPAMDTRAQAIVDYNAVSGLAPQVILPGVFPAAAAACLAAIRALPNSVPLQPLLATPAGLNFLITVHALSPTHLVTINTMMLNGANVIALTGFNPTVPTMARLDAVLALLPPMVANAALVWGRGGEADTATNQRVHFDKHVLKVGNDDALEPWKWKQLLNIDIQAAQYTAWAGHSWSVDDPALFPDPTASITTEAQYQYFIETFLPGNPAAQAALRAAYQAAYTNLIAANSNALTIVISDGGDVFKVMGNKVIGGHTVFIVGKLEDDLSAFTISTAYAPVNDKVAANQVRRLYHLA